MAGCRCGVWHVDILLTSPLQITCGSKHGYRPWLKSLEWAVHLPSALLTADFWSSWFAQNSRHPLCRGKLDSYLPMSMPERG